MLLKVREDHRWTEMKGYEAKNISKLYKFINSGAFRSLFLMGIRMTSLVAKFAITMFIARYIDFEALGLYGLISAASIVAPSFLGLGLPYIISRNAVSQDIKKTADDAYKYFLVLCIIYLCIGVISLIGGVISQKIILTVLIFSIVFLEHLNGDIYQLFLNLSKPFVSNILHFIRSGLWIIIYAPLAIFFPSLRTLEYILIAWLLGCIVSIIAVYPIMRLWPWTTCKVENIFLWLKDEIKKSKIIYFNGLAYSAGTYIDRYLISIFLGLELTGVYVLYWSIYSALCNLIRTGVLQTSRPLLVKFYKEKSPEYLSVFIKCLKNTFIASICLSCATYIGLYLLIPYLHKPLAVDLFNIVWFMLGALIITSAGEVLGLIFYSQHRDYLTLKVSVLQICCSTILNISLLPIFGIWGACISLVSVSFISMIYQHNKILYLNILFSDRS